MGQRSVIVGDDLCPGDYDCPRSLSPMWPLACGRAKGPAVRHPHSADHRRAPQPQAKVATYLFSASEEGSSILSHEFNEEKLPWMSSIIALLTESGSSRLWMEVEALQGCRKGKTVLSGGPELEMPGQQPSLGTVPLISSSWKENGVDASPEGG